MSPSKVPQYTGNRWFMDPHVAHYFEVEIDGIWSGRFQECSGLSITNEIVRIKEGGLNSSAHKFINRSSAGDITLKVGFWNNPELFWWFEAAALDSWTERKNGSIIILGDNSEQVTRWNFYRAFPLKWEGPQLNAMSSTLAMESVTLACEWIEMEVKFDFDGGDWF